MALNLEKEFEQMVREYREDLQEDIERALTAAGNFLIGKFVSASPVGDSYPHFKDCWAMKTKYLGVRYVGNTKSVPAKDGNIPIANIIEYGPHAKPFMGPTFEENKDEMYQIFFNSMKKGGI